MRPCHTVLCVQMSPCHTAVSSSMIYLDQFKVISFLSSICNRHLAPHHHSIPYTPSIPPSLPLTSPSLSAVKVKSNWILPSLVYTLGSACTASVCSHMHPSMNRNYIRMTVLYPWLYMSLQLCPSIQRELNLFARFCADKCRCVSCVR